MNRPYKHLVLWIIIALIIIIFSNLFHQKSQPEKEISYTEFLDMVDAETISGVVIQGQALSVSAAATHFHSEKAGRVFVRIRQLKSLLTMLPASTKSKKSWEKS